MYDWGQKWAGQKKKVEIAFPAAILTLEQLVLYWAGHDNECVSVVEAEGPKIDPVRVNLCF
jgi:hypothetical protein